MLDRLAKNKKKSRYKFRDLFIFTSFFKKYFDRTGDTVFCDTVEQFPLFIVM